METLLQALALDPREPFSLELAGQPGRVRLLVRAATLEMQRHLADQIRLAYPSADLREIAPGEDPAQIPDGLIVAASELRLRAGNHLPLKTWHADRDWQQGGDPLLGLLATLGGGDAESARMLCQLVLRPAPPDWSRGLERLALENPVVREDRLAQAQRRAQVDGAGPGAGTLAALLAMLAGGLQARAWWTQGYELLLVLAGAGAAVATPLALVLLHRLRRPAPVHDPRLVADKIGRLGYHAHIRLIAAARTRAAAMACLARLQAAYSQYNLATGNSFVAVPWKGGPTALAERRPFWRPLPILNARELAGLWHLPRGADEVPFIDRTAARRLAPTLGALVTGQGGCAIGTSPASGAEVQLPEWALRSNMLLVAKTGKGKSTLLERLAAWLTTRRQMAVVIFDPHGDLAFGALGALAAAGVRDPVYVDFADTERPVGLNLLDAHAGRSRDKAVANVIDIFSRVWERFWGARMENCLRFCLLAPYEVNTKVPPDRQYGVLHVKRLLLDEPFRRAVLPLVDDFETKEWWRKDYASMPRNFAAEVTKPVITKLNRFAGTEAAPNILSQPRTTLDLRAVVHERRPLLVNTAAGLLGPGTSSLLGATLLDLLGLVIMEQAKVPRDERAEAWVAIDEFSAYGAVDWAALLGQLRKFGGHFALATQSLADLDAVDPKLRDRVFANIDTLAVFQTSAADAYYLKRELDGAVDEQDLTNLPPHALYLKTAGPDVRVPTCLVQAHPPIAVDRAEGLAAARRSARHYGRLVADIERMRKVVGKQHHAWTGGTREASEPEAEQPELSVTTASLDGVEGPVLDQELRELQQEMEL